MPYHSPVKVNGEVEFRANYKVREGDEIEFEFEIEDGAVKEITPENIDLDIVYENEDLIVVNKPVGMVVHPATSNWSGTLLNALYYRYKELKDTGSNTRSLSGRASREACGSPVSDRASLPVQSGLGGFAFITTPGYFSPGPPATTACG